MGGDSYLSLSEGRFSQGKTQSRFLPLAVIVNMQRDRRRFEGVWIDRRGYRSHYSDYCNVSATVESLLRGRGVDPS